jgi:hypothetical protein
LIATTKNSFSESATGFNEIGAELVGTDSKIKINGHFKSVRKNKYSGKTKTFQPSLIIVSRFPNETKRFSLQTFIVKTLIIENTHNHHIYMKRIEGASVQVS